MLAPNTLPFQLFIGRGRGRSVEIIADVFVCIFLRVGCGFQFLEKVVGVDVRPLLDSRAAPFVLYLPIPIGTVLVRRSGEIVEFVDEVNRASDQVRAHGVVEIAGLVDIGERRRNRMRDRVDL